VGASPGSTAPRQHCFPIARNEAKHGAVLVVSARLNAILSLLQPCLLLADVGTDHALVPVTAVQRGLAARALAADLRALPLAGARQNIERAGLAAQVTVLQGNGLVPLRGHAVDAVVIAGMSGATMVRMLAAEPSMPSSLAQLVLQPNQDVELVRAWAFEQGFHLRDEAMIEERGQFFPICAFVRGQGADPAYGAAGLTPSELFHIGPWLLARRDPTTLRFCEQQRARLCPLVAQGVAALAAELQMWQRACAWLSDEQG
jgi:tRNA (adenine22-N1)-methyltransferase